METQEEKQQYLPPRIEVIVMENEGVIAASADLPIPGDGGNAYGTSNVGRSYNSAGSSELEDLINDILTVEQ